MQSWKKVAAIGAVVLCVAAVVAACGSKRGEAQSTAVVVKTTAPIQKELPVSEDEALLLSDLYRAMVRGDYDEAASVLNENETKFDTMMLRTLKGEKYSYYEWNEGDGSVIRIMEPLTGSSDFEGMVLTRYNTVFYGSFVGGKPNGEGAAIQSMILDHPRYSYAEGTWKDGKLHGEGRAGYYYYQDVPKSGLIRTEKKGNYKDNLLDGTFLYLTENANGEKLTWEMKAVNGVTVISENWEHYPYRREYMLGSVEDPARCYVLSEDKTAIVLWNNLILWD